MPVLGVGPFYVSGIFIVTVSATIFRYLGWLRIGTIDNLWIRILLILIAIVLMVESVIVWCLAVFGSRMVESVKTGQLMTTGIYAWVRHPVYTAFFLLNTGFLILQANWWLMVLPFGYWLALSILLKYTEELWLQEKFGAQYARYAARVNRVFPWPPRGPETI
nr:isoprenylcysteine carboxylmethyltransferase family protein [Mobiluncus curtisii]